MKLPNNAYLVVSDEGEYAPQRFIEYVYDCGWDLTNVDQYDLDVIVTGPSHEEYWTSWKEIREGCTVLTPNKEYYIIFDTDIWIVPE